VNDSSAEAVATKAASRKGMEEVLEQVFIFRSLADTATPGNHPDDRTCGTANRPRFLRIGSEA
jgi:hypothetical protein